MEKDWGKRIRRRIRLEELIEPERLFQIQERYARSVGVSCGLMDIDGNWIGEPSNHCEFCQIIRTTQKGRELCLRSDRKYMEEAAKSEEPIIYHCEAELIDFIAAIRVAGDVVGYILGAQVLTEPFSEEQIANIDTLADRLDLADKKEALKTAAGKIQFMSEERAKQAAKELQNVATELSQLSWYARQMRILDETSKRLAGLSSKENIRETILDGVESLLGEVNICIYLLEEDGRLYLFGSRREAESLKSIPVDMGQGYIGWVAENRQPLLVPDVDNYAEIEARLREQDSNRTLKSALTVPMLGIEYQLVGALQVASTETNAFHPSDIEPLEILANYASMVLEGHRLNSDSMTISAIKTGMASPLELDQILNNFLQTGFRILNFSSGDIELLDKTGQVLQIRTAVGPLESFLPLEIESNLGVSGRVMREKKTVVVNDLAQDSDFIEILGKSDGTHYGDFLRTIRSTVKTPIRINGTIIGILCIHWNEPNAVHPNAVPVVEFLAESISAIIETIRIQGRTSWTNTIFKLMIRKIESGVGITSARRELYQSLVDEALRITQAKYSSVRLYEEKDETLRFVAFAGEGWTDEIIEQVYPIVEESAGTHVVKTGQPFIIKDVKEVEYYKEIFSDVRSHVSVPILFRGRILGVLSVDANRLNAFSSTDLSNLQLLATQCSMMLEHFALIEESWFYELEKFLADTIELKPLCEGVLEHHIKKLFGVRGCSIFLKYPSTENLQLAATTGIRTKEGAIPEGVTPTYDIGEGLTGWVAENRQILRLRHVADEERAKVSEDLQWFNKWFEDVDYSDVEGHRTFLAGPITVHDKLIGVLRLTIKEDKADFTYNDEHLIESIAGRLALSIQNIWLTEESKRRLNQLEAFRQLGDRLAETLDLQEVAKVILEEGLKIIGCSAGHIRVFDKVERNLKLVLAIGQHTDRIQKIRKLGDGISGVVARERKPWIVPDVSNDERCLKILEEDFGQPPKVFLEWIGSEVCFPLIVQSELVGALNVHWSKTAILGDDELRMLNDLANRSAIAIKAALMFEEIENELKRALRLAKPLAIMGSMLGSFLHVARTPLHRLSTALDIVQNPKFDKSSLANYLEKMREAVNNLKVSLKDIALFPNSDYILIMESVDLNASIEKVVNERDKKSGENINYVLDLTTPSPILSGNRVLLEQAFRFIIGNAIEAMPDGGNLSIETGFSSDSREIVVRFQDTGIGMDEQTRARCLEPFFTTKEGKGGTGLGLPAVYEIVTRHSGTIHIESEPGNGTIVTLKFQGKEEIENATSSCSG